VRADRPDRMRLYAEANLEHEEGEMLLEAADVGAALGLSKSSVRRLAEEGVLAIAHRTKRGGRLFTQTEVDRAKRLYDEVVAERERRQRKRRS
jgi:hypothetical protein